MEIFCRTAPPDFFPLLIGSPIFGLSWPDSDSSYTNNMNWLVISPLFVAFVYPTDVLFPQVEEFFSHAHGERVLSRPLPYFDIEHALFFSFVFSVPLLPKLQLYEPRSGAELSVLISSATHLFFFASLPFRHCRSILYLRFLREVFRPYSTNSFSIIQRRCNLPGSFSFFPDSMVRTKQTGSLFDKWKGSGTTNVRRLSVFFLSNRKFIALAADLMSAFLLATLKRRNLFPNDISVTGFHTCRC